MPDGAGWGNPFSVSLIIVKWVDKLVENKLYDFSKLDQSHHIYCF